MSPFTMYQEAMSTVRMLSCSQCMCCLQSVWFLELCSSSVWVCVEQGLSAIYIYIRTLVMSCTAIDRPSHTTIGVVGRTLLDKQHIRHILLILQRHWKCVHGTKYNQCPSIHRLHAILSRVWVPGLYAHRYHVWHYPISHPVPVRVCHPTPPGYRVSTPPSLGAIGTQAHQQKELYNKKVHGRPFECGFDSTRLSPLVVNRGSSAAPGPYCIIRWILDATYRIQNVRSSSHCLVVHFDCLKLCPPNMCFPAESSPATVPTVTTSNDLVQPAGTCLEIMVKIQGVPTDTCRSLSLQYTNILYSPRMWQGVCMMSIKWCLNPLL